MSNSYNYVLAVRNVSKGICSSQFFLLRNVFNFLYLVFSNQQRDSRKTILEHKLSSTRKFNMDL